MIEIKNVSKSYDDNIIFSDFSMEIEEGSFVVFAGKSGCGKTTLLNMIGGLEEPDDGKIIVDGKNLYLHRDRRDYFSYKVGFLFQNFALIESKTVAENLILVPKKARTSYSVSQVLEKVGLSGKENIPVYKLSGGEQQRAALARLMLKKCDIILADEPTGSLDAGNAAAVMDILHQMNEEGKTIVLVTHDEKIIGQEENVILL